MEAMFKSPRLQITVEWVRRFGLLKYLGHASLGILKISRLDKPAVYQKLMKTASRIEVNPFAIAEVDNNKVRSRLERECTELRDLIQRRLSRGKFPANWNSGVETAVLLYLLVRKNEISKVLEIGTGNGISTLALYLALKNNTREMILKTVDISKSAGSVLNKEERSAIELEVVEPDLGSKKFLFSQLESFNPDMVFVDGAHDYLNVINDLELSLALNPKFLIADDIEVNDAWQDFCFENKLTYRVFLDGRKVLGICKLS